MKKNNEIITNDIDKFPEFENIRNAILEAREKVATTVNFAMVSAYWTIGKQLHEAMSGDKVTREDVRYICLFILSTPRQIDLKILSWKFIVSSIRETLEIAFPFLDRVFYQRLHLK